MARCTRSTISYHQFRGRFCFWFVISPAAGRPPHHYVPASFFFFSLHTIVVVLVACGGAGRVRITLCHHFVARSRFVLFTLVDTPRTHGAFTNVG